MNKGKCDLAQKLDITMFTSNITGITQFNARWVFDPEASIIMRSMIFVEVDIIPLSVRNETHP